MHDPHSLILFFFNDTATTEIYTLSLHDALPILEDVRELLDALGVPRVHAVGVSAGGYVGERLAMGARSEEHTSELQSRQYLVCGLLLEKKKKIDISPPSNDEQLFAETLHESTQ